MCCGSIPHFTQLPWAFTLIYGFYYCTPNAATNILARAFEDNVFVQHGYRKVLGGHRVSQFGGPCGVGSETAGLECPRDPHVRGGEAVGVGRGGPGCDEAAPKPQSLPWRGVRSGADMALRSRSELGPWGSVFAPQSISHRMWAALREGHDLAGL